MKINKYHIYLILTLVLSFFLRFYRMESLPVGIYWDEAVIGYDAYSISKTGLDHTGNLPITYLKSFGDYKNPLYVYLTALVLKITQNNNNFSIRFVSAFSGFIAIIYIFLLTKLLTKSNNKALLASLFFSLSPWAFMISRAGFEANLFLLLSLIAFYLILLFFNSSKKIFLYFSSIFFSLTLYSYHSAKITTPLILLSLFTYYRKKIFSNLKIYIMPILIFILFCLPFLSQNSLQNTVFRLEGVSTVGQEEIYQNFHFLQKDKFPQIVRFFYHPKLIKLKTYLSNYFKHFEPNFLFFEGDKNLRHSQSGFGQLHFFELVTITLGSFALFWNRKIKKSNKINLLILLLISPIPSAISVKAPHALRSILLIIPLSIISALGFVYLYKKISKLFFTLFLTIVLFSYSSFYHSYFSHYKYFGSSWQEGYKQTINKLKNKDLNNNKIIFSNKYGQAIWYLAYYLNFDPSDFQKNAIIHYGDNGHFWETIGEFHNFKVVKKIDYKDILKTNNIFLVMSPEETFKNMPIIDTIYDQNNNEIFIITNTSLWPKPKQII